MQLSAVILSHRPEPSFLSMVGSCNSVSRTCLFLLCYEYKYIGRLTSSNWRLAKKFGNAVSNSNFANEIPNSYPPELVLKRTTESPAELSYLDIAIRINSNRFITTLHSPYLAPGIWDMHFTTGLNMWGFC